MDIGWNAQKNIQGSSILSFGDSNLGLRGVRLPIGHGGLLQANPSSTGATTESLIETISEFTKLTSYAPLLGQSSRKLMSQYVSTEAPPERVIDTTSDFATGSTEAASESVIETTSQRS